MLQGNSKNTGRRRLLVIALGVTVLLLAVLAFFVYSRIRSEQIDNAGQTVSRQNMYLTRNDQKKQIRDHLKVLLVTGTDTFETDVTSYFGPDSWVNQSQADFVMLMVFDLQNKTVTPVQLNRDTMCDVFQLQPGGKAGGTVFQQLTLSHSYGSGGDDSVRNVARTVSKLLFGVPLDNYVSFTMSAVPVINDLVGGVTLTLDDDYTDLDPAFTRGSTVTLSGEQALSFVRSRQHDSVDANLPRMSRQRLYLTALKDRVRTVLDEDPDLVTKSFDQILPYMTTDLNLNSYADYANWIDTFTVEEILTPAGSYTMGEQWAEFNVDQDNLWDIAVRAFC